ncbi:MAG: flavodoxin family protein [Pacificimonas sp.]
MSVSVAIVYHSGFGHTKRLADAVVAGAHSVGASAYLLDAETLERETDDWAKLSDADAIIFGSPTYMGSVSGPMEAFFDASVADWKDQKWKDKLAGGFTNSGNPSGDKAQTLLRMFTFAAQHGMLWVPVGDLPAPDGSMNRLAGFAGAMAQSDDAPPEDGNPPEEDLNTARSHGARIAAAAMRWKKGGI